MRVVVNQLAAMGVRTGIGHYTMQLLRCLGEQAGEDQVYAYPQGWMRTLREWGCRLRLHIEASSSVVAQESIAADSLKMKLRRGMLHYVREGSQVLLGQHFRWTSARHFFDLYHEPNFIPFPSDYLTIATLHDLSVLLHPEWHPADRVAHFERYFHHGLVRCSHYLAISEFGRQEIIHTLGIPPEQVTCTYMGIRPGLSTLPSTLVASVLKQLGLPPRYLLYLGTIEPRKNVRNLLHIYCSLPESLRREWPLLLVGSWGWNSADVADYIHHEARHRGVIHLGYMPEEHLPVIYNGARALLYPSLYEGFGLPPIEMMACGGAVLASTAGALVETIGSKACLIPALDNDSWRSSIQRVLTDDDWWRELRAGVEEVARPYTWERCAADTWRVYRQLSKGFISTDSLPQDSLHQRKAG